MNNEEPLRFNKDQIGFWSNDIITDELGINVQKLIVQRNESQSSPGISGYIRAATLDTDQMILGADFDIQSK